MSDPAKISRRALYDRIWSKGSMAAAKELGLRYTDLIEICEKHQVPRPDTAYWVWKQRGRNPQQVLLPSIEPDTEIALVPHPSRPRRAQQPKPETAGDAAPLIDKSQTPSEEPASGISIPESPIRHHPLVRQTLALLTDGRKDANGCFLSKKGCLSMHVTKPCLPRAARVLDALIKACEDRGWQVKIADGDAGGTHVHLHEAEIPVTMEERIGRTPREPTESEKSWAKYSQRPERQRYAYHAEGLLVLRLDYTPKGKRATWSEGRSRIEDILVEFVSALDAAGLEKRKSDLEWEEQRKRWAEETRQRQEHDKAVAAERERVDRLLHSVETWDLSRKFRAFIEAVVSSWTAAGVDTAEGSDAGRWIKWARLQADRLDPLVKSAPSILDGEPEPFVAPNAGAIVSTRNIWRKVPPWVK